MDCDLKVFLSCLAACDNPRVEDECYLATHSIVLGTYSGKAVIISCHKGHHNVHNLCMLNLRT